MCACLCVNIWKFKHLLHSHKLPPYTFVILSRLCISCNRVFCSGCFLGYLISCRLNVEARNLLLCLPLDYQYTLYLRSFIFNDLQHVLFIQQIWLTLLSVSQRQHFWKEIFATSKRKPRWRTWNIKFLWKMCHYSSSSIINHDNPKWHPFILPLQACDIVMIVIHIFFKMKVSQVSSCNRFMWLITKILTFCC